MAALAELAHAWGEARTCEAATKHGHPLLPETETGRRVAGLTLTEWPMAQKDSYARIFEAFNARVNEASAR